MDYKLVKQLKDSGFPFKREGCFACQDGEGKTFSSCTQVHGAFPYYPTLSELIKACGEDFNNFVLMRNGKLWSAGIGNGPFEGTAAESFSTPEEAVANLWLALNAQAH